MIPWHLTEADIERAEWFLWNGEVAESSPELRQAVAAFEADGTAKRPLPRT